VYKITEIKQADHEDINKYFSKCITPMIEFKSKIDPNRFVLTSIELTAAQSAIFEAIHEDIKTVVSGHIKTTITEMTFDNVSAILITAELKSELRTEILKNNYIILREIQVAVLKAEKLIKEKPIKANNPFNKINNQGEDVDAIYSYKNRGNFQSIYRGNQYNSRGRGGYTPAQGGYRGP
jgi:hypothetical protein